MSKRARILVIDDDPLFRTLITSLLRSDFHVTAAPEGAEGFFKALEQPPDVAIIDIQMPNWDGLKTLKAFRGHPALSQVRTMILTSDASKETVLAAIHGGASDYIIKTTFSRDEFLNKIQRLLPEPKGATAEIDSPAHGHSTSRGERKAAVAVASSVASAAAGAETGQDWQLQAILDDWD